MIAGIGRRTIVPVILLAAVLSAPGGASALDKKASYSLSRAIMGGYYEKLGEIDKAIEEYKNALRYDRENALLHLNLASAYLKKNDIEKATGELTLAGKYDPDSVEPHAVLALLYFSQNKPDEAGREYELALEKASRLDPKNAAIYRNLAAIYMEQGKFEAAERAYRMIVGISPTDHEAFFFLANACAEQRKRPEAVEWLRKTLEIKPDFHPALNYLGYMFVEDNVNLDEAGLMIDKALELDPENGAYIDSRGWLKFRRGQYREAAADLEKAGGLIEDPVVFDHLGDVYMKLDDTARAIACWEKSLELDPKQEPVMGKLESVKKQ